MADSKERMLRKLLAEMKPPNKLSSADDRQWSLTSLEATQGQKEVRLIYKLIECVER